MTPGMAQVLGSNLTGPVFFRTGNIPFHKKLSAHHLSHFLSA